MVSFDYYLWQTILFAMVVVHELIDCILVHFVFLHFFEPYSKYIELFHISPFMFVGMQPQVPALMVFFCFVEGGMQAVWWASISLFWAEVFGVVSFYT